MIVFFVGIFITNAQTEVKKLHEACKSEHENRNKCLNIPGNWYVLLC